MKWLERKWLVMAVMAMLIYAIATTTVLADPIGTNVTVLSTGRGTALGNGSINAQAGNVSALNINDTHITDNWAGFYGNVTGNIILESAAGDTFYDWQNASPGGEIFAARAASIDWSSIACAVQANVTAEETALSITTADRDSINNTFHENMSSGTHNAFSVGTTDFIANACVWRTNGYVSGAAQTTIFDMVMLNSVSNAVYTAILNQDQAGFDGSDSDFQLLVPVTTEGTEAYYFWAELS
ncbi:MAG: hypothetical protein ABIE94_01930 [archaeon]